MFTLSQRHRLRTSATIPLMVQSFRFVCFSTIFLSVFFFFSFLLLFLFCFFTFFLFFFLFFFLLFFVFFIYLFFFYFFLFLFSSEGMQKSAVFGQLQTRLRKTRFFFNGPPPSHDQKQEIACLVSYKVASTISYTQNLKGCRSFNLSQLLMQHPRCFGNHAARRFLIFFGVFSSFRCLVVQRRAFKRPSLLQGG